MWWHIVCDEPQSRPQTSVFYGCLAHAKRGDTVCDNALVLPIERVDRAVQATLGKDVLRPAVVRAIIDGVFKALQPRNINANVGTLRTELRTLDTKIANLTDAIEGGAVVAPLVTKLQARQKERDELLAAIGAAEAVRQIAVDRPTVEGRVLEQVSKWQALLTANVADGRQALREVLDGPIHFAPDGKQYRFSGHNTTGQFIAGLVGLENSTLWRPQREREIRTNLDTEKRTSCRSAARFTRLPNAAETVVRLSRRRQQCASDPHQSRPGPCTFATLRPPPLRGSARGHLDPARAQGG